MSASAINRRQLLAVGLALAAGSRAVLAQGDTIQVLVEDLEFTPAAIEARAGDVIEWVNNDRFAHTATVRGGWDIHLPPGATVSHVLSADDTVEYYCRFHPNMTGSITITA